MTARGDIESLEALIHSPGWALLTAAMTERTESYERDILGGSMNHDRYVQATAERAAALGVLQWPAKQIELLTATEESE